MALTPGEVNSVVGTTAYPSLACGGKLTFRRVSNQSIDLLENITYGRCVDQVKVILQSTSKEKLQYKAYSPRGDKFADGSIQKISAN